MKIRIVLVILMVCLFTVLMAWATGSVQLPKTGQTIVYATGDDGSLQTGVASPSPRFTDNSNGTVTDNLTGLIWLKNATCTSTVGGVVGGANTWAGALTWSNNLASGSCGLSDGSTVGQWRLPNVNELESLVDLSQSNPALSTGFPFTNVQSDYYWSSTTYPSGTASAWNVVMSDGSVFNNGKNNTGYVWPVRGSSGNVPTISGTPSAATVGTSYSFTPTTTNATSFTLTAGTLPPGLALNASTGAISGTPTTAGTYSGIQITATGSNGSAVLSGLSITVNKVTTTVISWPEASSIILGHSLGTSVLSNGTGSVAGSFAFTSPTTVPASTGLYSASVTFTPTNSNYATVTGTVAVTISGKPVPVMEGWWLLPGVLAGLGMAARRRNS